VQILRRLLAYPALAREFGSQIGALATQARQAGETEEPVDLQIAEVLHAAGPVAAAPSAGLAGADDAEAAAGAAPSCAALIESLSDSAFAAQYRAMAARELGQEEDFDEVRAELADGVLAIEEARIKAQLDVLSEALSRQEPSAEERERNRLLLRRLSELKLRRGARSWTAASPHV